MQEVIKKNNIIKKDASLVKSATNLTLNENKIILKLISMIKVDDVDFEEYEMSVKEFVKFADNIKGRQYQYFKQIASNLTRKQVLIKLDENRILDTNWVISAEYINNEAYIKFMIHPKLKPYLLNLKKNFLQYDINNVIGLKSIYSYKMYELIKNELNLLKAKVKNKNIKNAKIKFAVAELRKMLNIPDSYRYDNIKSLLHKVAKDFEKHSDISFLPITKADETKTGRRVTEIILNIYTVAKKAS